MTKLARLSCLFLLVVGYTLSAQPTVKKPRATSSTLYERLLPSTVFVSVSGRDGKQIASGSGVVLSPEGLILTNYHVVEGGVFFDVRIAGHDGPLTLAARASKCAPDQDLAVLSIAAPTGRLKPVKVAAALPKVGDRVLALGSPLALEGSLSDGIVSQVRRLGERTLIQTTAPISPGSSGGGLFLTDGRLVGVTTMMLKGGQGLNFAVSSEDFARLVPCDSFPQVQAGGNEEAEPTAVPTPTPTPSFPCDLLGELISRADTFSRADRPGSDQWLADLKRKRPGEPNPGTNVNQNLALGYIRLIDSANRGGAYDALPPAIAGGFLTAVGDLARSYSVMVSSMDRAWAARLSGWDQSTMDAIGESTKAAVTFYMALSGLRDVEKKRCLSPQK